MNCVLLYFREAQERKKAIGVILILGSMATIAIIGAFCVAFISKYNHNMNLTKPVCKQSKSNIY
jgi:hypothetical protein